MAKNADRTQFPPYIAPARTRLTPACCLAYRAFSRG